MTLFRSVQIKRQKKRLGSPRRFFFSHLGLTQNSILILYNSGIVGKAYRTYILPYPSELFAALYAATKSLVLRKSQKELLSCALPPSVSIILAEPSAFVKRRFITKFHNYFRLFNRSAKA